MLRPDPHKRWIAVLVCYLDESGEDQEPIITMAGFLSTEDRWRLFEITAGQFFDRIGLDYLHSVCLQQRRGYFSGQCREQTADFANAFCRLLKEDVVAGFEFSVLKSRFQQVKRDAGLNPSLSALGACFQGLLDQVVKHKGIAWALAQPDTTVSFVIEQGHRNEREVMDRFNAVKRQHPEAPLGYCLAEDKKKVIALQAADFLAYFSRRLRTRDPAHKRTPDEFKFFRIATDGLPIRHFLATDFES
jgi:Protein of unknown function (DUF3800)